MGVTVMVISELKSDLSFFWNFGPWSSAQVIFWESYNFEQYCKFINVGEGFIWRISRPSLNHKNKYPANLIHVPKQLTRPKLTANINPRENGFCLKNANINPREH